jgi:hypothetical protein
MEQAFDDELPMSRELFEQLFDYLDEELENGCDNTLYLTESFLKSNNLKNIDDIKNWLGNNGGYCDCEVLANVEELFE